MASAVDPWAVVSTDQAPSQAPVPAPAQASNDPWAVVGSEPQSTSTLQDIEHSVLPDAVRGVVGAATMPGTLTDELKKGTDWVIGKLSPETLKRIQQGRQEYQQDAQNSTLGKIEHYANPDNVLPTYDSAMNKVQQVTGPLYQPQTPVGKAIGGAIEAFPSLAMGGEGVVPSVARAVGSGLGGEFLPKAADYLKPILPDWAQKYVDPTAQAVGAVAGAALGPKAVTPFPMSDARAATVAALKKQAPDFPFSAGQQAKSPTLLSLEARSPRMAALPDQQAEAFTNAAMREMGSSGPYNTPNLEQGKAVGDALGNARRAGAITGQNYQNLVQQVQDERTNLRRVLGTLPNSTPAVDNVVEDIVEGVPSANPSGTLLSVPGARYDHLRQKVQGMIDAAPTGTEKNALANIRQHLDNAFYNSLPADQANNVRQLNNQYSNYQIMQSMPPKRMVNETVSPEDVLNSAASYMGRSGVNLEHTSLAPLAKNAAKVMVPHPAVNPENGNWNQIFGGAMGALGAGAAGLTSHAGVAPTTDLALLGALTGRDYIPPLIGAAKDVAGRALSRPSVQTFLKNQLVTPNRADPSMIMRLLLSPPETQLLPQSSSP